MPETRWDRMSEEERQASSAARAKASRVKRGQPEVIEDPVVLGQVARLVAGATAATDTERAAS